MEDMLVRKIKLFKKEKRWKNKINKKDFNFYKKGIKKKLGSIYPDVLLLMIRLSLLPWELSLPKG